MARRLPAARVRFARSGVGIVTPPTDVVAVIGCCTNGPTMSPFQFSDENVLASERGAGPGVKALAYSIARTGAPGIFQRVPATPRAAFVSEVNLSEVDGTATATVTGTPLDGYDVVLTIVDGGTIGTTGITYTVSLDGEETTGPETPLGTATTIALTGTGLTINLVATETFNAGDVVRFYALPASAAILTQTTIRAESPPSTATLTLSGTPVDAYDIRVEITTGGTVGVKGIALRYSLDGGRLYSRTFALGTGNLLALLDGPVSSGLTLTIGAGTVNALDALEAKTTAPEPSAADVVAAIEELDDSNHLWSFLHVIMEARRVDAGDVGGALANLAADANGDETYTMACLSARDRSSAEDDTSWSARLVDDFSTIDDQRLAIGAGMTRLTCPLTGRRNRRPAMWVVVPRIINAEIEEDPGKKLLGALPSDVTIFDERNQREEHDARVNDVLHRAGFVTLRTYKRQGGVFVTRGSLFSEDDALVNRIPRRRVLDLAAEIGRQTLESQLENDLFPNADGTLLEEDAADIDLEISRAIARELGAAIVGASARVSRTDQVLITGRLSAKIRIEGKAYVDEFDAEIAFQNPQLTSAPQTAANG